MILRESTWGFCSVIRLASQASLTTLEKQNVWFVENSGCIVSNELLFYLGLAKK